MSLLNYKNIYFAPSFHNRIQFCIELRKLFNEIKPSIVAIELPEIYYSDVILSVSKLPKLSLLCLNNTKYTYHYVPIFPSDSLVEGIRLAKENSLPVSFIDLAVKNYKSTDHYIPPDEYAINSIGLEKFYELNYPFLKTKKRKDIKREKHMAFRLNELSQRFEKVLFVGGMAHWENIKKYLDNKNFEIYEHEINSSQTPFLAKPSKRALPYLTGEIPYLIYKYELSRRFNLAFDKWKEIINLVLLAKNTDVIENLNFTIREVNNLIEYSKKLAFIDNEIIPDMYNLLLSAKQTLGDDYAMELLEKCKNYLFENDEDIPEIDFDPEKNFTLGGRKITLKRSIPDFKLDANGAKWEEVEIVKKKKDELPNGYENDWFFFGFYSYIPEDIILEGFIDRLENKIINDFLESPKIKEFSGSLLDGLELRETIRDLKNKKIYVKEYKKEKIKIGSWLMVFDNDLSFNKYPWAMSLSAEHHNESDIAFYASNPLLHPVSRQIIKAEYGALLAFKPALEDSKKVFSEDIDVIPALRLHQMIMLSIDLCPRNGIIYVSSTPPESYYYKYAESKGKKIYYIPFTRFSQRNIKKLKTFHLLKSRKTRDIADDYI